MSERPDWGPRVNHAFDLVVVREPSSPDPWRETTREFPGVLASWARDPESMGNNLIRQAARQLAYDALEVLPLVEPTPLETFVAWGGDGASVGERIADLVVYALTMDRPAILPSLDALRGETALTAAGAALLADLELVCGHEVSP